MGSTMCPKLITIHTGNRHHLKSGNMSSNNQNNNLESNKKTRPDIVNYVKLLRPDYDCKLFLRIMFISHLPQRAIFQASTNELALSTMCARVAQETKWMISRCKKKDIAPKKKKLVD
jgi:hypothetical protein